MTVTGTFLDAQGEPRANTRVKFLPESNPQPDASGVLTAITLTVMTDDDGEITPIELEQGIYLVSVGTNSRDQFRITVPDSDATADITTLMEPEDFLAPEITQVGNNFRIKSGYLQLKNIETGLWHTFRLAGPVGMEQTDIQTPGEP